MAALRLQRAVGEGADALCEVCPVPLVALTVRPAEASDPVVAGAVALVAAAVRELAAAVALLAMRDRCPKIDHRRLPLLAVGAAAVGAVAC